ncbi:HET-domain-containing protein, partial [Coniophora puteana RWD-64-598 SS2]
KAVAYAILSHRWGEAEATYTEYITSQERFSSTSKPIQQATTLGYIKLLKFFDAASVQDIEFAWADTCCIDKSSSTELDEAIRSMFRWYKNSALCIVHLAQTTSVDDMARDEWFTRGWTLQEILAPDRIKFMDKDWKRLTTSAELLREVQVATAIPVEVLTHPFVPRTANINEKMSWAACRKSTRGEDAAYSLMGMLGVSIQAAYGEGRVRAFRRLFDAIVEEVED